MDTAVKRRAKEVADTVSYRDGVYTARREFFYTHGRTADGFAAEIRAAVPRAVIIDCGEVWKPFRGGAPTHRSSHWWVKFRVDYDNPPAEGGAT